VKYPNNLFPLALLGLLLNGCVSMPAQLGMGNSLMADEQNTIAIFEHGNPSVVCISAEDQVPDALGSIATGTGFIWDKEGHIVTTHHLVEGYDTVKIRFADQRVMDAVVMGSDVEHDIGVLKLKSIDGLLQPATLGSSNDLKVGQKVFTIGNSFDLGRSFTAGIISALGRSFGNAAEGGISNLIQTDASMNPGSSGSPLLDRRGRVIGVNVAIYSLSGGSEGIGFAVPMDTVKQVVPRLIKQGGV
jgi:S1-C subfamily serine protease